MQLRPTLSSDAMTGSYLELFRRCFPAAKHFSRDYIEWLYLKNPDGEVVGFDAFDDERLVATYVCIPARVVLRQTEVRALLSLNTATDPAYQGQGLFTRLAEATYDHAAAQGFDCVFGVANQNSIRGFSGKLGFQDVKGLEARIGVGRFPCLRWHEALEAAHFQRLWTPESLNWRVANPSNPLTIEAVEPDHVLVVGSTDHRGIIVQGATPVLGKSEVLREGNAPGLGLRLTLGLFPGETGSHGWSVSIPDRLKPSPLRLIYRSLSHLGDRLDGQHVLFSFLDFDAY